MVAVALYGNQVHSHVSRMFAGSMSWLFRGDLARILSHHVVRVHRTAIAETSPRLQVNQVHIRCCFRLWLFVRLLVAYLGEQDYSRSCESE